MEEVGRSEYEDEIDEEDTGVYFLGPHGKSLAFRHKMASDIR